MLNRSVVIVRPAGIGPRVGESTLGSMAGYPWTSPYEDLTLKGA